MTIASAAENGGAPATGRGAHVAREIVNVVQPHPFKRACRGVEVAGDGEIYDDQLAPRPTVDDVDERLGREELMRGARARHYDVGLRQYLQEVLRNRDAPTNICRKPIGALGSAAGKDRDDKPSDSQRPRGLRPSVPRADDERAGRAPRPEVPPREADSDRRDGRPPRTDVGLVPDAPPRGQGVLDQPTKDPPARSGGVRRFTGATELAQDLDLAEGDRLEAGGDPKEVFDHWAPSRRARHPGQVG